MPAILGNPTRESSNVERADLTDEGKLGSVRGEGRTESAMFVPGETVKVSRA